MALQEDLSEADRIKILLTKQDSPSLQQSYVFHNAVNIFTGNPQQIQQAIIPLILKDLPKYSEQLQIESAQAFTLLLQKQILEPVFFQELKHVCLTMLRQWTKTILFAWIEVYCNLVPQMVSNGCPQQLLQECVHTISDMSEGHHPLSVRMASAYFIGQTAKLRVLTLDTFNVKLLQKVKDLCHDRSWEVISEMCKNLKFVSAFIGPESSLLEIAPVIIKLINDEDQEVQRKAISAFIKHTMSLVPKDFKLSESFKAIFKVILSIATQQGCPVQTTNSLLKKLGSLLQELNSKDIGSDKEIEEQLLKLFNIAKKTNFGKTILPEILSALPQLYTQNGKFTSVFYPKFIKGYLATEITSQGLAKEIKKSIAGHIHSLLIPSLENSISPLFHESGLTATIDLLNMTKLLLDFGNKDITHELVKKAFQIFKFVHDNDKISPELLSLIDSNLKMTLFNQVDSILIGNWRYHLAYFELFLGKYLILLAEKDEATLVILPLMLKGASDPKTSQPIKKYLGSFFAGILVTVPNKYLRLSVQESLIKDFAQSDSSQLRLVFVYFLEELIPHISKIYFKQFFFESYLAMGRDQATSILLAYVKLALLVRLKLDDHTSINSLTSRLSSILQVYQSTQKRCNDLVLKVQEALLKLNDPSLNAEVQVYQSNLDKQLTEGEAKLKDTELKDKNEQVPSRKRQMEVFIHKLCYEGGFQKGIQISRIVPNQPITPMIVSKNPPLTGFKVIPKNSSSISSSLSQQSQTRNLQHSKTMQEEQKFSSRRRSDERVKVTEEIHRQPAKLGSARLQPTLKK